MEGNWASRVCCAQRGPCRQRRLALPHAPGWPHPCCPRCPRCAQEKETEARRASLGKWKLELLHRLMDALDLPRGSGDKVGPQESSAAALPAPRVACAAAPPCSCVSAPTPLLLPFGMLRCRPRSGRPPTAGPLPPPSSMPACPTPHATPHPSSPPARQGGAGA
jgi:hypothetical protein